MKKRLSALLCAVALCLSLFPAHAINAGDVYFTAVNNKLFPLSIDTMPTWVSGRLYVPASVFDSSVTGIDLGFYFRQSNNTVTLYTLRQMLVFDLNRGIAYEQHTGENLSARAVNRNGRIYLPVETVCDFFGLEDSYNYTQYGYLIRIKSEAPQLNYADFMDAASSLMSAALQEFLSAQQTPDDQPAPPTPPVVVEPPTPSDDPVQPPEPDDQPKAQTQVYLAVRCDSGEALAEILDLLEQENMRAMFFFAPQSLTGQDDLVRRVVGSGHSIGLLAEGGSTDDSRRLLAQGNQALAHIVRTAATAALVPADQRGALEADGWACWQETTSGLPRQAERPAAYAQRILRAMDTRRTVRLTLDDSGSTAQALPALLEQLAQEEYRVLLPIETRL